jgi:adenylate cyclase
MSRSLRKYVWLTLLVACSAGVGFYVSQNPALRSWEESALDLFYAIRPAPRDEKIPDVVLVMVDGKSLSGRFGYYDPLPRRYLAELVDTLSTHGAKVIALDVALLEKNEALDPGGDVSLHEAIHRAGSVASVSAYELDEAGQIRLRTPHPYFLEVLQGTGFANLEVSSVGGLATVRSVKPFVQLAPDSAVPSFSTLIFCLARGIEVGKHLSAQIHRTHVEGIADIPLERGSMLINFVGPPPVWHKNIDGTWTQQKEGRIVTYKSTAVTDGSMTLPGAFEGKVVFVGSFSEFSLDQFLTPYSGPLFDYEPMRGAEVHANAFLTLLYNRQISVLGGIWSAGLLLILAAISVLVTSRFGLFGTLSSIAAILLIVWAAGYVCFAGSNLWIPVVSMSATVFLSYVSSTVYYALTEKKERKRITGMFGQYVDERVVDQLIEHPEMSKIGGANREVTLLFSDLKGFTTLSERLGPENIVKLMNIYLTEMTDIIHRNEGTIDKFIGDSIMAFWGAPVPNGDAAYLACLSALQMQARLGDMKDRWKEFGDVEVFQRIGLNTGVCIIGNVGSARKTNYTALGDSVNLASRLEGVNKRYGTGILISGSTRSLVADRCLLREIEEVIVQGRNEPVKVFELRGLCDGQASQREQPFLELYDQALLAFKKSEWDAASELFKRALQVEPQDQVCKMFLDRVKQHKATSSGPRNSGS